MAQEASIGGVNVPENEGERVFVAATWPDSGVLDDPAPREPDGVEVSIRGRVRGIAVDFTTRLDTEFIDAALMALDAHHILPSAVAQMLRLPSRAVPSSIPIPEPSPETQPAERRVPDGGLTINGDLSVGGNLDVAPTPGGGTSLTVTGTTTFGQPNSTVSGEGTLRFPSPSASPQYTNNLAGVRHGTVLQHSSGRCGVVVKVGNFPFTHISGTPVWAIWRDGVSEAVDDYRHARARRLWPNVVGEGEMTCRTDEDGFRWRGEIENLRTDIFSLEPGWVNEDRLEAGDLVQNWIGEFGVVMALHGSVSAMWRDTEAEAIEAVEAMLAPADVRGLSHRAFDGWFRRVAVPPSFHGDLRALVTGQPSPAPTPAPEPIPERTGRKIIIK